MCVYVCREHVGIASKRIEHVNQALDNSSIYCCCWAILHGQIIYEKPNENLWQRLTSTKIHTHNLCVFFSRLANFHSAAIFVSTVSHLFSPCERALISARHFLLLLLCSARFRRIHENAVCIQSLQCRRLKRKEASKQYKLTKKYRVTSDYSIYTTAGHPYMCVTIFLMWMSARVAIFRKQHENSLPRPDECMSAPPCEWKSESECI